MKIKLIALITVISCVGIIEAVWSTKATQTPIPQSKLSTGILPTIIKPSMPAAPPVTSNAPDTLKDNVKGFQETAREKAQWAVGHPIEVVDVIGENAINIGAIPFQLVQKAWNWSGEGWQKRGTGALVLAAATYYLYKWTFKESDLNSKRTAIKDFINAPLNNGRNPTGTMSLDNFKILYIAQSAGRSTVQEGQVSLSSGPSGSIFKTIIDKLADEFKKTLQLQTILNSSTTNTHDYILFYTLLAYNQLWQIYIKSTIGSRENTSQIARIFGPDKWRYKYYFPKTSDPQGYEQLNKLIAEEQLLKDILDLILKQLGR